MIVKSGGWKPASMLTMSLRQSLMRKPLLPLACGLALLATQQAHSADDKPKPRALVQLTDEALRIHREALVIDGHNDLPYQLRKKGAAFGKRFDLTQSQPTLHTDIPRLKKGGVGAQFWSAWVAADP